MDFNMEELRSRSGSGSSFETGSGRVSGRGMGRGWDLGFVTGSGSSFEIKVEIGFRNGGWERVLEWVRVSGSGLGFRDGSGSGFGVEFRDRGRVS
ncbi:hypothetical protein TIFTF001_007474 [Ficus carica]|uniref:Uncharacterized protein n=1 Tax=Ficus carica TaxID=3494 RepID=A0AA87ZRB1_FICCA|nr:hypothetical protein TIFTF001_007474 [Ficus carica]